MGCALRAHRVGRRATAWPSGLQGGCETSLERKTIHPQGGAQGDGGLEPEVLWHLAPRSPAPAGSPWPASSWSGVSGPVREQQRGWPGCVGRRSSKPLLLSLARPAGLYRGGWGLFELTLPALLFCVTTCSAKLRWTSAVCASLWLKHTLSKVAPFLGRKMLFRVGKGCLEFPVCFSSRLWGVVSPAPNAIPGLHSRALAPES